MFKLVLAARLCLGLAPAAAQTLQKCVGEGGAVAFRSGPCLPAETLAARRDGGSDRRTPEEWRQLRERQQRDEDGSRYLSRIAGTDGLRQPVGPGRSQRNPKVVRCEAARAQRDSAIKRLGGRAAASVHSYWNNRVYDACKP